MVTIPKKMKVHCSHCNKHTVHKTSQYKKGKEREMGQGTRRYHAKQKGYGGQKKPIFRKKVKTTKKVVLKLECNECKKKRMQNFGRAKSINLTDEKKAHKNAAVQY
jgi:large subunit ribosomal protein L44e